MAAIAVAGVGLMMMCSSSVAAAMMMGGEEKEIDGGDISGAGAGAPVVPTLPSGQYVKLVQTSLTDVINLAELEVFAKAGTTN